MNSARIELQRSFFVTQARVVVVVVDEVGAPEIMGVLNFPLKPPCHLAVKVHHLFALQRGGPVRSIRKDQ